MGIKENFQQAVRELTGGGKDDSKKTKPSVSTIKNAVAADDTSEFPAIKKSDASAFSEIEKKASAVASEYSRQQSAFNAGNYQTSEPIPDTLINSSAEIAQPEEAPISFGPPEQITLPTEEDTTFMPASEREDDQIYDDISDISDIEDIGEPAPEPPEFSQTSAQTPAQPSGMGGLIAERLHDDDEQTDVLSKIASETTPSPAEQISSPSGAPVFPRQTQEPPLFSGYPGKQQRDHAVPSGGFAARPQQQSGGFPRADRQQPAQQRPSAPTYTNDGYDAGYTAGYNAAMSAAARAAKAAAAQQQQPSAGFRQEPTDRRSMDRGFDQGSGGYSRGQNRGFDGNSGSGTPPVPPFLGSQGYRQPYSDEDETTVISRNTVIDGNIRSFANMTVEGNIKGNVETTKDIDLNGKIVGNIACNNAQMRTSQIQGNIQMKGSAFMERDTLLIGDLSSSYANVNGKIKGNLDITGTADLKSDAVIFGDINASTLSVLNGAIIQGYVSTTFLNKEESKNIFPDTITIGD